MKMDDIRIDSNIKEALFANKQEQAMISVSNMRKKAAAAGYLTEDEINAQIRAACKEMRQR